MIALGIDIGGTFTDLVAVDLASGRATLGKVASVPGREWEALGAGLALLGIHPDALSVVVHGTTVGTNAVLQGKGARTSLVATAGFRDVLEIGRCMRLTPGSLFDTHFRRPPPLVPRARRIEVAERIAADGGVLTALDAASLDAAVAAIRAQAPEAVAVCLMNAYANPAHEVAVVEALQRAVPGLRAYASHVVSPEYREYERFTTTAINAAVSPVVDRYLERFEGVLRERGFAGALFIMASNGGTVPAATAGWFGARTILSGPVGGLRGAILAAQGVSDRIITLDMGGTSTDVALIEDGQPEVARTSIVNGMPLRLAQLDIATVGAGGGSIVAAQDGGGISVGPESAGADPGPACYGRGGQRVTVTDANLALGRLGAALGGGALGLDAALARAALERLAAEAGMAPLALAEGAVTIAVATMTNAIREISVERGRDPRGYDLVAFGGAGPMHAAFVAEELGMARVLVPPFPGNVCAYGLLGSELRQDRARTWIRPWSPGLAPALLDGLETERAALEHDLRVAGWPMETVRYGVALDMRYAGQAFEIAVPLRAADSAALAEAPAAFAARHDALYGHTHDRGLEVVTLRVQASAPPSVRLTLPRLECEATRAEPTRQVVFGGRAHDCPVLARAALDAPAAGPAIIEEPGSTTVVPPGWRAAVAPNGTLILDRYDTQGRKAT